MVQFARTRQRQGHLQIAAQATAEAVELARLRYSNGVDNFLNVLDAERQLLELQDQLALSETETGLALGFDCFIQGIGRWLGKCCCKLIKP